MVHQQQGQYNPSLRCMWTILGKAYATVLSPLGTDGAGMNLSICTFQSGKAPATGKCFWVCLRVL